MKRKFWVVFAAALIIVCASAPAAFSADVNMQEGKWENTIEMKIEGLPFPMPPIKFSNTQCLTKKDMVPNTANKDQKCDTKEQKITGNKVTWKAVCVDKNGTSESEGEITYTGGSYQGAMRTKTTDKKGQASTSTTKLSGRRVGDCAK